ncbi:glycoside hydrolase family 105 protein [Acidaminobacter sp. JC074]|nr:glycoside hydrolase family 105 protein [Acidaminobacter sp. JC074]
MQNNNLAGDDISKYRYWEWTQGVGLYGFWKIFEHTKDRRYLETLEQYYEARFEEGLPSKNINTMAPMLTLAYLAEYTQNEVYLKECYEWAHWIMNDLPKTEQGGFQHITSDTVNFGELWDDTLFMTVLFLAKVGKMTENKDFIEEAKYQFMIHIKYLTDSKTGLWYHGWTFDGHHNFAEALWGRGNCWVTIAIPEFVEMIELEPCVKRFLVEALEAQVKSLVKYQNENGMWHTLINDSNSYVESSATSGFGYGILKATRMGLIDKAYMKAAEKAIKPMMDNVNDQGVVDQVSYGTAMGRDGLDFYRNIPIEPMPYGQALALLFLNEAKVSGAKII